MHAARPQCVLDASRSRGMPRSTPAWTHKTLPCRQVGFCVFLTWEWSKKSRWFCWDHDQFVIPIFPSALRKSFRMVRYKKWCFSWNDLFAISIFPFALHESLPILGVVHLQNVVVLLKRSICDFNFSLCSTRILDDFLGVVRLQKVVGGFVGTIYLRFQFFPLFYTNP